MTGGEKLQCSFPPFRPCSLSCFLSDISGGFSSPPSPLVPSEGTREAFANYVERCLYSAKSTSAHLVNPLPADVHSMSPPGGEGEGELDGLLACFLLIPHPCSCLHANLSSFPSSPPPPYPTLSPPLLLSSPSPAPRKEKDSWIYLRQASSSSPSPSSSASYPFTFTARVKKKAEEEEESLLPFPVFAFSAFTAALLCGYTGWERGASVNLSAFSVEDLGWGGGVILLYHC